MNLIEQLHAELTEAEAFERIRMHGYDEILAMSPSLLSDDTRAEVFDALQWSNEHFTRITRAIEHVEDLIDHSYPERVQQIAQESAIAELKDRLEMMRLAVLEFEQAPSGSATISEEIPVN